MQATATDTRPGAKEDVEKFHKIHHGYQTLQQEVMQAAQQSVTPEVLNNATQSPNPSTISAVVQTQPFFAKTVNQPLGQPKQVVLEKQPKKYLGMSMESTPNGLYITEVQEGKLANRSGGLVAGMVILEINARRADSLNDKQRKQMLAQSNQVAFKVHYDPIGHEATRSSLFKWYHGMKTEQETSLLLTGLKDGTFLACQVAEDPRCFALCVATKDGSRQFKIIREPDGVFIVDGMSGFDVPLFRYGVGSTRTYLPVAK